MLGQVTRLFAIIACLGFLTGPLSAYSPQASDEQGRAILGFVENARIGKLALEMKARLDTGAQSSSVHATDVQLYNRVGKDTWVRFRLEGKNGRKIKYNQNVIKFVRIRKKDGGFQRRPVVRLPLCVGGVKALAEVNLTDREEFLYDMLIGREFLAGRILVDSADSFLGKPECEEANAR